MPQIDDPQKEKSTEDTQEHEIITSPTRISAILRPLVNKHTLLTASMPNSSSFYNTALLKVDPENGSLTFDELNPKDGHDLLLKTKRTTIHMSHDGTEMSFSANLINSGSDKGMAFYEIEFPEDIRYLQRRDTFRVPVSAANEISIEIFTNNKSSFMGELHDISTGGMCIRFPKTKDIPENMDNGEVQCKITLLDKKQINCTFNVCHIGIDKTNKRMFVGGNFHNLDKIQRRTIEKFVVDLQRKARQKMSR